jgi:hypothetical protein
VKELQVVRQARQTGGDFYFIEDDVLARPIETETITISCTRTHQILSQNVLRDLLQARKGAASRKTELALKTASEPHQE